MKKFGLVTFFNEWPSAIKMKWGDLLVEKKPSPRFKTIINFIFITCSLTGFVWLLLENVGNKLKTATVSIGGNSSTQICHEVPAPISGAFNVDYYGQYDNYIGGHNLYRKDLATFILDVPAAKLESVDYTTMIESFRQEFAVVGKRSEMRTLVWQITAWTAMYAVKEENDITYRPRIKPEMFLGGVDFYNAWPRSRRGICLVPTFAQIYNNSLSPMDPPKQYVAISQGYLDALNAARLGDASDPSGILKEYFPIDGNLVKSTVDTINYEIYISRSGWWHPKAHGYRYGEMSYTYPGPCPDQFRPIALSQSPDVFKIPIAKITLFVAAAVNMGIIDLSKLLKTSVTSHNGMHSYVHPFHKPTIASGFLHCARQAH